MRAPDFVPGAREHLGVSIEVVYLDSDLVEFEVMASNGRLSGVVDLYDEERGPARLAEAIRGFPRSPEDRREAELGSFDPGAVLGGAGFHFRCTDRLGHAVMEVRLSSPARRTGSAEAATIAVPIEPAAVDEFVRELEAMKPTLGSRARLRQRE